MAWVLRDRIASRAWNDWTVSFDLNANPTLSIHRAGALLAQATLSPADGQRFLGDATLTPGDCYVRGNDVVATYPEKAPVPFGYETYCCWVEGQDPWLQLELWLSVQTSTLEAHPQLLLSLDSIGGELGSRGIAPPAPLRAEPGNYASLFTNTNSTIGIAVHPMDAGDVNFQSGSSPQRLEAFGRFMEKGVIRRLRLRWICSTSPLSDNDWFRICDSFADSPLPLTT